MGTTPALSLEAVSKGYSGARILESIDIEVKEGEFISLLGPSGCGKTTTLNIVAGFVTPDQGNVCIAGRKVNDIPPFRRDLGMVFQGHALFPHLTCFENVAFGLRMRNQDEATIKRSVGEALELVHLSGFEDRFPRQLSGGQQQRVGLARALVIKPRLLLLDEPLSNLDARLRKAMQSELRVIHKATGAAMLYVTHDQEEALMLSDRIAVMNGGRIEQLDTPEGIYRNPETRFVADFIGSSSFLQGEVMQRQPDQLLVRIAGAGVVPVQDRGHLAIGRSVQLGIRSDRIRVAEESGDAGKVPAMQGTVMDRAFVGSLTHVRIDLGDGQQLVAHLTDPPASIRPGARVCVSAGVTDWIVLP